MNKTTEALKMAIEAFESMSAVPSDETWSKADKALLACKEALSDVRSTKSELESQERPTNAVLVPADKLKDMQRRLSDCKEYLKEGETPAECIARNRKDASTSLEMLAKCMREKKALESQEQEPVAVIAQGKNGYPELRFVSVFKYDSVSAKQPDILLYTHPAQPLSDDEIWDIANKLGRENWDYPVGFARAIEQAHGIGVKDE